MMINNDFTTWKKILDNSSLTVSIYDIYSSINYDSQFSE